MEHDRAFELLPLYALDALEIEDSRELEAHLEACSICSNELARHRRTAAVLVPDEPAPSEVWDRIVAHLEVRPAAEAPRPAPGTAQRLGWLVAALLIVVLGALAVYQAVALNQLRGSQGVIAAAEAASEEAGAIVTEFSVEADSVARVILTTDGEGFIVPTELEPLGEDRTYQLWVVTPDELVISAGVLGSDPSPARFTWTGEVAGFVLTREVAGGVISSAGDVVSVAEL